MSVTTETELPANVVEAIHAGQKILAIKLLREHRALDLKTAKEIVEAYINRHPDLAARARANREAAFKTLRFAVILLVVLYAAYRLIS